MHQKDKQKNKLVNICTHPLVYKNMRVQKKVAVYTQGQCTQGQCPQGQCTQGQCPQGQSTLSLVLIRQYG